MTVRRRSTGVKQHVSHGKRDALLQTELVFQLSQTTQHTAGECRCNAYNQRTRAWAIVFRVFNVIGVTDRDNTDKTAPDSPLNDSSTRRAIRSLTLTDKFHKQTLRGVLTNSRAKHAVRRPATGDEQSIEGSGFVFQSRPLGAFFEFRKVHFSQNGLFGKGSFYFCLGDHAPTRLINTPWF